VKPFYGCPSKTGYYWHRQDAGEWMIVHFDASDRGITYTGNERIYPIASTKGLEWMGPIEPPKPE